MGLPPDELPLPIFDTVLNGVKIIGSIAGPRKDLQVCLQFAAGASRILLPCRQSFEDRAVTGVIIVVTTAGIIDFLQR